MDAVAAPPGRGQGHDDPGDGCGTARVRGLDLRRRDRPDVRERPRPGHPAPRPQPPARPGRSGPAGHVEGLRAGHRAADGDPARHVRPPGRLLPERARDRPLPGHRHGHRRRPRGDPARVRPPAHDRAPRRPAGLPHLDRGRSRDRGHPPTASSRSAATVTRHAEVIELQPGRAAPAAAFYFVFPTGTTMLY